MGMRTAHRTKLAELVEQEQDDLLARWRRAVRELPSAKELDTPTLNDHIPLLLAELSAALRSGSDDTIAHALAVGSAPAHGLQRLTDTFDIEEVVAEYNILRECIHDLAERHSLRMQGEPFHVLNRLLDGAIGAAVQSYGAQKALEVRARREEYLAFVAHDLRTPLSAIAMSAQVLELLLADASAATPQAASMWKALTRNVQHLNGLVNKVMDENANLVTESGVKLERRTFDLWPLVESLIHDINPVAGTGSTALVNDVPEDCEVYADAGLLRRILQNLIANAIDHTPRGTVTIGASHDHDTGATALFVRDDGAGIAADRRQRVFEKGERDSEKDGSTGLGLAIVKTFVEAHGGEAVVDTELGIGSTFRFTLKPAP
jgi:signal transduction histidine kinase